MLSEAIAEFSSAVESSLRVADMANDTVYDTARELSHARQTATEIGARVAAIQEATRSSTVSIDDIDRVIEGVSTIATAIGSAVEEQTAVTSEIAEKVQDTADSMAEVLRSIERLGASTSSASAASEAVTGARNQLDQQIQRLRQDIDTFLVTARSA